MSSYDHDVDIINVNLSSSFSFSSYFYIYDWGFDDHATRTQVYTVSFFSLLFLVVVGLLFNALQLYGIVAFPCVRKKVENVFIAYLTIVNIVYLGVVGIINLIVCGSFAFLNNPDVEFNMTLTSYIMQGIVQTVFLFIFGLIITVLAIDQYLVIAHPIAARTPRNALKACIAIVAGSVVVAIVEGFLLFSPYPYGTRSRVLLAAELIRFLFLCVMPVIVILAFNLSTSAFLRRARPLSETESRRANNALRFTQLQEENGEVPGAVIRAQQLPNTTSLTILFVVCWFTNCIIHVVVALIYELKRFNHPIYENNRVEILYELADVAAQFNAAFNPVLYGLFNQKFRQHLLRVVLRRHVLENTVPLSEHTDVDMNINE